jgi:hypothetical protein
MTKKVYLIEKEYELIQPLLDNNLLVGFHYPNMVRIRTIADGSCFFHAIVNAFFLPYRTGRLDNQTITKNQIVKNLRHELSIRLSEPIEKDGPTHYDLLSAGELKNISQNLTQYSLENMKKELDSKDPVDNVYQEFISNQLNKDIYIIDWVTRQVVINGNDNLLYKNRGSIVLLYLPGHYELIGLIDDKEQIETYFKPTHPFIQTIRSHIRNRIGSI